MLINVATHAQAAYRVLVLAPDNPKQDYLAQLGDLSDIAALCRAGPLHVDALVGDASEDELAQALLEGRYSVFHGALHGDGDGVALTAEFLERERLGELLQVHGVNLAVLLSCDSEPIARRVAEAGVCCVVGTTVQISNEAAYEFCLKFYRHLLKNREAGAAYDYAMRLLKADFRKQFVFVRGQAPAVDPLQQIIERLARLELQVAGVKTDILRAESQGHQEITGAMLQLLGLFQGLLGERK